METRKLPKKTIVIISIMVTIIFAGFFILTILKEQRLKEVVATLGHKNTKDMQVINKLSVEDKETRYKSKVYKIKFFDNDLNKTCIGFVHFGKNNKFSKDFDCK